MSTKSKDFQNEWGQIGSLIEPSLSKDIVKLYSDINKDNEFEIMFYNYNETAMNYEKYRTVLSYVTQRSKSQKLELISTSTLDIIYAIDGGETTYRISIQGIDNVNKYMKMVHQRKNHVIFRVLVSMIIDGNKDLVILRKVKEKENVVDVDDFDMRIRKAEELSVEKKELKQLVDLSETERDRITFRFKERVSLFLENGPEYILRIDLTKTKMTKQINKTEYASPRYELELELTVKNKPSDKYLTHMMTEANILLKILQQSNFIISKTQSKEVLSEYARILSVDLSKATTLDERRAQSLEVQHVTETLSNKFAPTDKADGERYFLVIINGSVYIISHNLIPKFTGIILSDKLAEYNDSILDGEYIFIPAKNRYLFMAFDCLHNGQVDVRKLANLVDRLKHADEIIGKCFILKGQTGFKQKDFEGEFKNEKIIEFHSKQIETHVDFLNKDIDHEKQFPLVRRKYFIPVYGGNDSEVFKYAELLWDKYKIKCPYHLDGIIFHPLVQEYITSVKESRYVEYKWKPPATNSIDFYVTFERDETGKILTVYDNSVDEFAKNKPYRICYLNVGQWIQGSEQPTLFQKESDNYIAHLFLQDGEVRDLTGNIIQDKTVIEMYYNNDPNIDSKFRWVPMRTRYDKTESVQRHRKGYGNYIDIANKVWRSITNPILMDDMRMLANEKTYHKHMDTLRKRIGHELIISAAKENVYFQIRTNLAKPMRQFHNWVKSILIYTHCHPLYQSGKNLSVLDIACGRGQDLMKFYYSQADMYVGVDIDYDALTSAIDGAMSRYQQLRKQHPNFPKMFFIQADASMRLDYSEQEKSITSMSPANKILMDKFFSFDPNKRTYFDRINCQFALHYFLKNNESWNNFKENINMYLKNGGYLLFSTFDARMVLRSLGDSDKHTIFYTNTKGEKKILFDIVKKFETIDTTKPIPAGYPIDFHNALISREDVYNTEYLVDLKFMEKDLLETCGLELVDSDLFSNQFELHRRYFVNIATHEENVKTRQFLLNAGEYYNQSDEINKACYELTKLYRYYVFRKKDDFNKGKSAPTGPKQSRQNVSQSRQSSKTKTKQNKPSAQKQELYYDNSLSNNNSESEEITELDNPGESNILFDKTKFYIGEPKDKENSYYSSIFEVLQNDDIVPKEVTQKELFKDLGIKVIPDANLDKDLMFRLAKKIKIEHELQKNDSIKKEFILNGINVFTVELDCNGHSDVSLISKNNKLTKKDKSVILIQDGTHFRPVYQINGDKFKGIHMVSDKIIESLVEIAEQ